MLIKYILQKRYAFLYFLVFYNKNKNYILLNISQYTAYWLTAFLLLMIHKHKGHIDGVNMIHAYKYF